MSNVLSTNKYLLLFVIFIFSLINNIGLAVFLILILMIGLLNPVTAIISINLVTLRTIMNPGIAVPIDNFQSIKWVVLFLCSVRLFLNYKNIKDLKKLLNVIIPILAYIMYSIISSFLFSSLPMVAILKIISYGFIFVAILIGVESTIDKIDWLDWLYKMMTIIPIVSVFLIPTSIGYLRNARGLQGITNHPNLFGILLVMFIAINITRIQNHKFKYLGVGHLLNVLSLSLIWMSQSRTSLITAIIIIIIYIFLINKNLLKKTLIINSISLTMLLFFVINRNVIGYLESFLLKGSDNLINSRAEQIATLQESIEKNPLFGTGFAVPVLPVRSYAISSDFIVEPGNIVLSVVAYGGVFGLILFSFYFYRIIKIGKNNFSNYVFLPISTILISLGEMVFFSSNNIGPWLYMFIAIYLFDHTKIYKKSGGV